MLFPKPTSARRPRLAFRSGILDRAGDLPLRRYRLCRQAFWSEVTQVLILGALAVSLTLFGRSLLILFARHGAGIDPWQPRAVLGLLAVAILLILRRFLNRVRNLRLLRLELAALKVEIEGGTDASEA